jgi:hypothetical protein
VEFDSGHIKGSLNIPLDAFKIIYPVSKKIKLLLPAVLQPKVFYNPMAFRKCIMEEDGEDFRTRYNARSTEY